MTLEKGDENMKADFSLHDLKTYYDRIFPFKAITQWLTQGKMSTSFGNREFALVMSRGSDDIYLRWQSFKSVQSWRSKISSLDPLPHKIDIGAIYSLPIANKDILVHEFKPVAKEMVFDIDMDDYNDIRTCCQSKTVCKKCWRFLAVAAELLDRALREDFGFRHIMWVFSGRRGIHCWVCDKSVMTLPSDARAAVADYLNLATGSAHQRKKVKLYPKHGTLHPMEQRAFDIARNAIEAILLEQDWFTGDSPLVNKCIDYFNPKQAADFRVILNDQWRTKTTSEFWDLLKEFAESNDTAASVMKEIVLGFSYPRLDIAVSKDMCHLLKSPFCVHRSTGRICVPIPLTQIKSFDPLSGPSLARVVEDKVSTSGQTPACLQPFIDYFENDFLHSLLTAAKNDKDTRLDW